MIDSLTENGTFDPIKFFIQNTGSGMSEGTLKINELDESQTDANIQRSIRCIPKVFKKGGKLILSASFV